MRTFHARIYWQFDNCICGLQPRGLVWYIFISACIYIFVCSNITDIERYYNSITVIQVSLSNQCACTLPKLTCVPQMERDKSVLTRRWLPFKSLWRKKNNDSCIVHYLSCSSLGLLLSTTQLSIFTIFLSFYT